MLKLILNWVNHKIEARKIRREARLIHSSLIASGQAVRDHEMDKPDEDQYLVDYNDTRMMGQKHVTPNIIRPFGMGKWDL